MRNQSKVARGLVLALVLGVAACGTTTSDRAITGGAIGAATGAAGAAVFDGDVGAGAVLGGIVGAGVGAATDPDDIYLGEPVYRQ